MRFFSFAASAMALALSLGIDAARAANPQVEIKTSMGSMTVELYADKAPKTVDNFLGYVKAGFYGGTIFHRVIPGFMIQGGGYTKDLSQKPTQPSLEHEGAACATNDLGTIAMARTGDPHSATSQFFINVANNRRGGATVRSARSPRAWMLRRRSSRCKPARSVRTRTCRKTRSRSNRSRW
jgi:cyclophilin family peptidyl-prolyl cis-trans isomerase